MRPMPVSIIGTISKDNLALNSSLTTSFERFILKKIPSALDKILAATQHDPFACLGAHLQDDASTLVTCFQPYADKLEIKIKQRWKALDKIHPAGLFTLSSKQAISSPYLLRVSQGEHQYQIYDAYSFTSSLSAEDLYLFAQGRLNMAYRMLGAQVMQLQGVSGVRFAVWAPNAERVSVIGDFNRWDGRVHSMRSHGSSGIWEIFIPHLCSGDLYKFEIRNRHTGHVLVKTDPYGFAFEARPGTAAKVVDLNHFAWQDQDWLKQRQQADWLHTPMNCYECHLGSWHKSAQGEFLNFEQIADQLIPYLQQMGYTHLELMPISEHPLTESWGYQTTGYYAVTTRYGTPAQFKSFINRLHQANIGVILDWVPGHFPKDDWALARFDGTALYEHEDPRLGEHQDWGTYIFNYGRNEVRNFLLANAYFWLSEYHIDGLRVDAVASMLYLDYSRKQGEWLPNQYGGRENLDAIEFLKQLNLMVHEHFPGSFTIAEESTSWPMISRPVYAGGLGFSMKWNMGWMNDTLSYIENDPVHRQYHHNKLTFGQLYAYSENFVLPFSHDEVVHGKKSLLDKMPGDAWQRFANLRLLLCHQMCTPGKKLNFMGNEFAQGREWNVNSALDWYLLDNHWHQGVQKAVRDLNHLYLAIAALHELDFEGQGFEWIDCNDASHSTLSYIRRARDGSFVLVLLNFTPVPRHHHRINIPEAGEYEELFNSDSNQYGGSNLGNAGKIHSEQVAWMGPHLHLTLPPLAGLILRKIA